MKEYYIIVSGELYYQLTVHKKGHEKIYSIKEINSEDSIFDVIDTGDEILINGNEGIKPTQSYHELHAFKVIIDFIFDGDAYEIVKKVKLKK